MKKVILLLLCVFGAYGVNAAERSLEEMRQIAASVLSSKVSQAKAQGKTTSLQVELLSQNDVLTVMGSQQAGLVVISNDDATDAVLGYSFRSSSSDNPQFKWWLNTMTRVLEAEKAKGNATLKRVVKPENGKSVEPMITSTWGQGSPFNNDCPGMGSGHYPTGCQATAMAQIMYHWKYPTKGTGSNQYSFNGEIYKADFSQTTYDWDNMIDNYSKSYTDAQATAVATLMWHCGAAINMQYTASGSGAFDVEACKAFNNNFGYKDAQLYNRDYYSEESWMKMVYQEIDAQRPILYTGVDATNGGHAFVLDGYDSDGLVHINWGWNGSEDGYFDIAKLNPANYAFSLQQGMIVGLTSEDIGNEYQSQITSSDLKMSATSTRITLSGSFVNMGTTQFDGLIGMTRVNLSTGDSVVMKAQRLSLQEYKNGRTYSSSNLSFQSNWVKTPGVTYRVYLVSKADREKNWQLVRNDNVSNSSVCSAYQVTVDQDNHITVTPETSDTWTGISSVSRSSRSTDLISVYNSLGRRIYVSSAASFRLEDIPARGLLIVKDGQKTYKVVK